MYTIAKFRDALIDNNTDLIKTIIQSPGFVNLKDAEDITPLHTAAVGGYVDVVKTLLGAGANKDAVDYCDFTPLHFAACYRNVYVVKALVDAGANKDAADNRGFTPLHIAIAGGNVDVIKTLLGAGANKDAANKDGGTPLHFAVNYGQFDVLKKLLDAGANKDAADKDGRTPLHIAAHSAAVNYTFYVVKTLLDAGADTLGKDRHGKTALDLASEYLISVGQNSSILDFLRQAMSDQELERGLRDLTEAEKQDVAKTFLHGVVTGDPLECQDALEGNIHRDLSKKIASFEGSEEDLAQLIKASKPENDINAIRSFESTGKKNALHLLAKQAAFNITLDPSRENGPTYAEMFLDILVNDGEGAEGVKMDINARDVQGKTPLHIAIIAGNIGIIPQLALHRADLNAKFIYKGKEITPLEYALMEGNEVLARAIINMGQDYGCDTTEEHPNIVNLAEFALCKGMMELYEILEAIEEAKMAAHAPSDGAGGGAASSAHFDGADVTLLAEAPEAPAE